MDPKDKLPDGSRCTLQLEPFDAIGAIATERGQARDLVGLMDNVAKDAGGPGVEASYRNGVCSWCGKPPGDFADDLSRKEWLISRLCQGCQDRLFAEPEDDGDPGGEAAF